MTRYIAAIALTIFSFYSTIYAAENTSPEPVERIDKKASAIEQKQNQIMQQIQDIEFYLGETAKDRILTNEEMRELCEMVNCAQKEIASMKEVYGVDIVLDCNLAEIVRLYETPILRDGARDNSKIKLLIAMLTGKDIVKVQEDFSFPTFFILFVISAICCIVFCVLSRKDVPCTPSVMLVAIPSFIGLAISVVFLLTGLCGA